MANINEGGRYAGSVVDEVGRRVFSGVDEVGELTLVTSAAVAVVAVPQSPGLPRLGRRQAGPPLLAHQRFDAVTSITTTVNVDVAGSIAFTGQDLPLILDVPHAPTTFALPMRRIGLPHRGPPVLAQQIRQWPLITTVAVDGGAITLTGQDLALKQSQAASPGAITFTGQALPLVFTQTITAGSMTFAGQDLPLIIDVPRQSAVFPRRPRFATALSSRGPPVLARQRFDSYTAAAVSTVAIDTPGAVVFTGSALAFTQTQQVVAGAVLFTGSTLGSVDAITVTAGAITFTGSSLAIVQSQAVTAGAITLTGQALGLQQAQAVVAGAITFTGQPLGVQTITPVSTAGQITFTGQALPTTNTVAVTPGAITFTGQDLTLLTSQPTASAVSPAPRRLRVRGFGPPILITQRLQAAPAAVVTTVDVTGGAMTFTGQALGIATSVNITAGAVAFTGQALGIATSLGVTAGQVTFTGKALGLKVSVAIVGGQITLTGQTLTAATFSGTGPDVFTAILRPRWHASTTLRWAASSKTRWRTSRIRARWLAWLRSRIG